MMFDLQASSRFSVRPAAYAFITTKRLLRTESEVAARSTRSSGPLHCTLWRHETFQP